MEMMPTESQVRRGWAYLFFQLFLLTSLLPWANQAIGSPLNQAEMNFLFYLTNFLAVAVIFFPFWIKSIVYAFSHFWKMLAVVLAGVVLYALCDRAMSWILNEYAPEFANVNNIQIAALFSSRPFLILVGTVVLAPIAEECFFRELMFHHIYSQNKVLAYLLSAGAFAAIHVVGFLGQVPGWVLGLCFLQYLPAGLILAGSYAASGCLLAPVAIHALINFWSAFTLFRMFHFH